MIVFIEMFDVKGGIEEHDSYTCYKVLFHSTLCTSNVQLTVSADIQPNNCIVANFYIYALMQKLQRASKFNLLSPEVLRLRETCQNNS